MFGRFRQHAVRLIVFAAILTGTLVAHAHLAEQDRAEKRELWVPDPRVARIASIGFQSVVSDYYWLQALQVVGASRKDPSQHGPLLGRLVDLVTTLNPWVDHPYRFATLWMTDSLESVRKADAIMDRGIAHHPHEWRNPFYQGVNRLIYLGDEAAAADALEKAAKLPRSPRYLPRLVARLRSGGSGLEAAAALLSNLARNAEDPYVRAEYEKGLDEIETERRARFLDAARAEFRRRHGRDLSRVEELLEGPEPVLAALPPELHGWEWVLAPDSGEIVSSWYGVRYRPFFHPAVAEERDRKRAEDEQRPRERL